jgi:hypothetical protein
VPPKEIPKWNVYPVKGTILFNHLNGLEICC